MYVGQVKLKSIARTICPRTGIHYLDAVDKDGQHWVAEMSPHIEKWLCYTKHWQKAPQQPFAGN
jgi:hypothetical protein